MPLDSNPGTESKLVVGASGDGVWNFAITLLDGIPTGRLLEVAAGGGFLAAKLTERGFEVIGSDLVNQWQFPEIPFICADLDCPLPFEDSSFDVIVFTEGIGFVENINGVLREFRRVLKPGGSAIITLPNIFSLQSRIKFALNGTYRWFPHPRIWEGGKADLFDIHHDPPRVTTLQFYLRRAGFDVKKIAFGSDTILVLLAPIGLLLQGITAIENLFRSDKKTPTFVNSFPALLHAQVGIVARRSL